MTNKSFMTHRTISSDSVQDSVLKYRKNFHEKHKNKSSLDSSNWYQNLEDSQKVENININNQK